MDIGRIIISGMGLGAALAYWADTRSGARRRARIKELAIHGTHEAVDAVETTARDLRNRVRGRVHHIKGAMAYEDVPDDILRERVRSRLGHVCSHPGSVDVEVDRGHVVLRGVVLEDEIKRILAAVRHVPGARTIDATLEPHTRPGSEPGLQGVPRRGTRAPWLQPSWNPTTRLVAGLSGAGLLGFGLVRRNPISALGGTALLIRAATNLQLKRLLGVGTGRGAITVQKTMLLHAPVEEVYALWSNLEAFPRFMSHVREVRHSGEDLYHWKVDGPGGTSVEWDAVVTRREPNHVLAWKSVPGAAIPNAGIIHFTPANGGTQLDIRFSYSPPVGALGHVVAAVLGVDPKKRMDDDLLRFKSLVEAGKASGHERLVRKEDVAPRVPGKTPPEVH
ncbi:MAG: SRPBCC family protein [Myxococcota bacterium]